MKHAYAPPESVLRYVVAALAIAPLVAASAVACSSSSSEMLDAGGDGSRDSNTDGRRPKDGASENFTIGDSGANDSTCRGDGAGPSLSSLSVTASVPGDAAPITLVPAFSPDIHDYYVQCASGSNALTVSMTAAPGADSSLLKPTASPRSPKQTLSVSVTEGEAIVAAARRSSPCAETAEYWIRCLPHDFPPTEVRVYPEAGTPAPGYYLFGSFTVPKGESGYAIVMDANGVPVWYYKQPNGTGVDNVDNVVDGSISFIPFPKPFPYEIHALSPLKTSYLHATALDEHELRVLANGDYLVLTNPHLSGVDLSTLKLPLADGGTMGFDSNADIQDCHVVEIAPDSSVVWQWVASQHFDPAAVSTYPTVSLEVKLADGGTVVDAFHCNSIDVDEPSGNLLVSARNMDSVFYIEKLTKRVLWKMGGADSSKDNATYVSVANPFYRQHDARLRPGWSVSCGGGAGQISMFDDESARPGPARGVVYDVTVPFADGGSPGDCGAPPGDGGAAASVAWEYKGTSTSAACGSFRILPDGSRTIGWGVTQTAGLVLTEVDVAGHDLMDLEFADKVNSSYRAIKVPLGAFDLNLLRATSGQL